jgi:hypothetical protein
VSDDLVQNDRWRFTISELSCEFPQISRTVLYEIITATLGHHKFHLQILKPNNSQSSECTHIHQTNRKMLTKVCLEADGNCFLGEERSADGGTHATRDRNSVRSVLRNTKKIA